MRSGLQFSTSPLELFKNKDEVDSLWKFSKLDLLEKDVKSNFLFLFQAKMSLK